MEPELGTQIEWLIIADAAQVLGNKLYLLGGGWDTLTVGQGFPVQQPVSVAISFRVPWHETNQKHEFELEVFTDSPDGKSLAKVGGAIEVGRPPGIKPGQSQRLQAALNILLRLEAPGTYSIVGRIHGQEQARTHFNVIAGPGVSLPKPRPQ